MNKEKKVTTPVMIDPNSFLFGNDSIKKVIIEKEEKWISVKIIESEAIETFLIIGEPNTSKFYFLLEELRKL